MRALGLLWRMFSLGAFEVTRATSFMRDYVGRTPAEVFLRGFRFLLVMAVLLPVLLIGFAVVRDNDWLVLATGIVLVVVSAILWIRGAYVVFCIDFLRQVASKAEEGPQPLDINGKAYIKWLFTVLATEIFIIVAGALLPWDGNIKLAVMGILAAAGLGMVYYLDDRSHHLWRKTMEWSFLGVLVGGLIYLVVISYFPGPSADLTEWFNKVRTARVGDAGGLGGHQDPFRASLRDNEFVVAKDWQEVVISPRHWFRFDVEKPILVKRGDGKIFTLTPEGVISEGEKSVPGFGDVVPGFKLFVSSRDGSATKVLVSQWAK